MMLALPHFSLKVSMALRRQDFTLERPKVKQKSFVAHTRHPCRDGQRAASMPHTRIQSLFTKKLKAKVIFTESCKQT